MSGEEDKSSWLKPLPEEFASDGGMSGRKIARAGLAIVVLGFFAALIWYSYMGGTDDGPVPVVRADKSVVKEKPKNPGGLEVPNRDKQVFERVAPGTEEKPETLAASGELPLERPEAASKDLKEDNADPVNPAEAAIAEIPVVPTKETVVEPPEVVKKPVKKLVETLILTGDFLVQLGAFRKIETAEQVWEQLQRENPAILGDLVADIMRADLGARGIYYRLRGGWLPDRQSAMKICAALKAKKKPCLVVAQ